MGYVGNTGHSRGPHAHFELKLPGEGGLKKGDDGYNNYRKDLVNPIYYIPLVLNGKLVNREQLLIKGILNWKDVMGIEAIYAMYENGLVSNPAMHDDMSQPMEKWFNLEMLSRIYKKIGEQK